MERHYPNYDIAQISQWQLIRGTQYSESNYVKTVDGEFIVDIQYTPETVLTVTVAHNGSLSKNKLEPILGQCGRLALTRGNYKVINYALVGSDEIGFGNYGIGER